MTTYSSDPQACESCAVPQRHHGIQWTQRAGSHSWTAPTTETVTYRMRVRHTDPNRWIAWRDLRRITWRKWKM